MKPRVHYALSLPDIVTFIRWCSSCDWKDTRELMMCPETLYGLVSSTTLYAPAEVATHGEGWSVDITDSHTVCLEMHVERKASLLALPTSWFLRAHTLSALLSQDRALLERVRFAYAQGRRKGRELLSALGLTHLGGGVRP